MSRFFQFFAVTLIGATLSAAEVFKLEKPQDFNLPKRLTVPETGVLEVQQNSWFFSNRRETIQPDTVYSISAQIRLAPGKEAKTPFSIGFYSLDKNNRVIQTSAVFFTAGSETEIAADVKEGDKVIKIKDGSKWKKNGYVAYDIDPTGKYRDLPCHTIINAVSVDVKKNGDVYEVVLPKPAGKNLSAGVAVRQHLSGWSFLTSNSCKATADWQNVSWKVRPGEAKTNTRSTWLFGARKFVVVMVAPAGVQIRNIVISAEGK